ncbi:hypothetical protein CDV31_014888 [Fusarium ambrosium]|uniref:Uncharacterized protein n=1 Tax=Fusarium ambrosium TaxID=131363 RepID=A0A428STB6_9HYPO|nr:hypothetical protein CDV31_014888 [Fusarium ambrosium]
MESLAYAAITLRTRHLHATRDPRKGADACQETPHNELGSVTELGSYKLILQQIAVQTENCPLNPSIDVLARCWSVHDYYKEPNEAEEPQRSLHDIIQRLEAQGIRTNFETPKGLDYLKTLASIACGINKTLELGMVEKHEDKVIDILGQTVQQLEARSNVGGCSVLLSGGDQMELAMACAGAHQKAGESNSDFQEETTLALRLKNSEV